MTQNRNFLAVLNPISLQEMDAAALMNRVDTKFLVRDKVLPNLIAEMITTHRVLEINGDRSFEYNTTYYDTEKLFFLNEHLRGKKTRFKVRKRAYVSSGLNFLELKNKTNKGRTIKSRVKVPLPFSGLNNSDCEFLSQFPVNHAFLKPVINIHFERVTLVSNDLTERLTIDRHLRFSATKGESSLKNLAIIELKQGKQTLGSASGTVLRKHKIFPLSMSKYCVGMLLTHKGLKYNRFKPKLLKINKLTEHGNIWDSTA